MKKSLLLVGLTCLWSNDSQSWDLLLGHYQCKVLTQQVTEVVDGKTNLYSGYENGYVVGDTLDLSFYWNRLLESVTSVVSDDQRDFSIRFVSVPRIWGDWIQDDVSISKRLHVTEDQIHLSSNGTGSLTLNRYYKNDWNGILIEGMSWGHSNDDKTRVTTLDCRTRKDVYSELFEYLKQKNLYSKTSPSR